MTRHNAEESRLDRYAKGFVALLDDAGNGEARPPAARAQSFRMLSGLVARHEARARSRRILAVGVGCAVIAGAMVFGARSCLGRVDSIPLETFREQGAKAAGSSER